MNSYYVMNPDDAKRFLRERDGDDPFLLADVQRRVGEGPIVDDEILDDLREHLLELKKDSPSELTKRSQEGGRFEQLACERVHRGLSTYSRRILADPGFWIWLAVAKFSDIIEWRFGTEGVVVKYENYGIGKPAENLLFRLWLRGEIGYDSGAPDPYILARSGDQDLWRSHIIRQGYANAREIARALLRLQADRLERDRLAVGDIRELAKRLRRLRANVFFEVLSPAQANELILELSDDLSTRGRANGG